MTITIENERKNRLENSDSLPRGRNFMNLRLSVVVA